MDKKLQKEILKSIRNINNKKGTAYNMIVDDLSKEFCDKRGVNSVTLWNNVKFLNDLNKIEGFFERDQTNPHGPLRITALGLMEFDPWYKKFWRFFSNDFAKILSIVALILSIVATIVSLLN